MAILEVTSRQFRDNQKTYFDLADAGKQIVIRRGHKQYTLTTIKEEDFCNDNEEWYLNPLIEEKIELALNQEKRGEGVICKTFEESFKYLESL